MKDDNYIFEKFLDGRLEGEALIQFQEKLNTDQDFAHRFGLYKRMDDLIVRMHAHVFGIKKIYENIELPDIRELENVEQDIEVYLKTQKNTPETTHLKAKLNAVYEEFKHNQSKKSRKSALLGIAASLAVLVGLSVFLPRYFFKDTSNEELYHSYYSAYPCVFNKRGCNQEEESVTWKQAVNRYQQEKYPEALVLFNQLSDSAGRHDIADFLAGICYMELDSMDQAKRSFIQIAKRPGSLVHDHALWYLGLTCLQLDQRPEAVQALSSIGNQSSEFYDKAQQILSVLE
jgi:tetratricopeptide (TPR) repeat protein